MIRGGFFSYWSPFTHGRKFYEFAGKDRSVYTYRERHRQSLTLC